ncbi:MAG: hypothetical protein ABI228_04060 [Burkholderiaceae bacterium]
MSHSILVTLHLFAAFIFVGTVFFEVLILEGVRKYVPHDVMRQMELGIGQRARKIMPWAVLVLYGAGIAMAWQYRAELAHPFATTFGTLLTLKIALALSVLVHFVTAIKLSGTGKLKSRHFRYIHLSVFAHMIGIVFLAKAMFFLHW